MKTILVVDDEAIVIKVLKTTLERGGYRVLTAESGAEASRICEPCDRVIDLLVTDHSLKSESGRQVTEKLLPLQPDMKVLQISGWPEEILAQEGNQIPNSGFLQKPSGASDLIDKVRTLLN